MVLNSALDEAVEAGGYPEGGTSGPIAVEFWDSGRRSVVTGSDMYLVLLVHD